MWLFAKRYRITDLSVLFVQVVYSLSHTRYYRPVLMADLHLIGQALVQSRVATG